MIQPAHERGDEMMCPCTELHMLVGWLQANGGRLVDLWVMWAMFKLWFDWGSASFIARGILSPEPDKRTCVAVPSWALRRMASG
jgi:hypothetical protein